MSADKPTAGVESSSCAAPLSRPSTNVRTARLSTPGMYVWCPRHDAGIVSFTTEIAAGETVEGDEFIGKISKDVLVDGRVVIPRGTQVHGVLSSMEGPKRAGAMATSMRALII
ncbi:MAG: hypothetical protein IPL73_12955 [Candidatus Obscuribacter sp.]|nr:hypothetical protein [Candidatus Obscuribacter sp.]